MSSSRNDWFPILMIAATVFILIAAMTWKLHQYNLSMESEAARSEWSKLDRDITSQREVRDSLFTLCVKMAMEQGLDWNQICQDRF